MYPLSSHVTLQKLIIAMRYSSQNRNICLYSLRTNRNNDSYGISYLLEESLLGLVVEANELLHDHHLTRLSVGHLITQTLTSWDLQWIRNLLHALLREYYRSFICWNFRLVTLGMLKVVRGKCVSFNLKFCWKETALLFYKYKPGRRRLVSLLPPPGNVQICIVYSIYSAFSLFCRICIPFLISVNRVQTVSACVP